jgi:hypothetical protein
MHNFPGFTIKNNIIISNEMISKMVMDALIKYTPKAKELNFFDMIGAIIQERKQENLNAKVFISMSYSDYTCLRYIEEILGYSIDPFSFFSFQANNIVGNINKIPIHVDRDWDEKTTIFISNDGSFLTIKNITDEKFFKTKATEIYSITNIMAQFITSKMKIIFNKDPNFIKSLDKDYKVFKSSILERYNFLQ